MSNIGANLVHSELFHQARPDDYPDKLINRKEPVSFHKFWQNNPKEIYEKYFKEHDVVMKEQKYNLLHPHSEL